MWYVIVFGAGIFVGLFLLWLSFVMGPRYD